MLSLIESTPNSSTFIVFGPPPPPKASNIVHEHWVDCVSPLHRVDSMSPTFFESTACPLPSLGCLHAPTFLRRLCVNCLSSRRLHDNYTRKPRAPPKSRATCRYPRAAYLPSLVPYRLLHLLAFVCQVLVPYRPLHLLPFVCRLLVRVDHLSSRRLLVGDNYSLYQHLSEILCAVQNIFNERVMDRGYLGDVGRRTVMRFGTVDPKRPAVAIVAMHPRSLDSSWRG